VCSVAEGGVGVEAVVGIAQRRRFVRGKDSESGWRCDIAMGCETDWREQMMPFSK
jgi:hypothetical protein